MKKIRKQILGCFGLGLVAAMTIVAVSLPAPGASALSSVTDTVQVRVVSTEQPTINVTSPVDGGETTIESPVDVTADYANVETIHVSVDYTDSNGITHHYDDVQIISTDQEFGTTSFPLIPNLGYGDYVYTIVGEAWNGAISSPDIVHFEYAPFVSSAEQNKETGETIDVTIGPFDEDEINGIEIWVNGKYVETVYEPGTYPLKPDNPDIDATYNVTLVALHNETDEHGNPIIDDDGNPVVTQVYKTTIPVDFKGLSPVTPAGPDTGRFLQKLNVSSEDYLVTSLIVFFIIGVVAIGIITRKQGNKSRKRR